MDPTPLALGLELRWSVRNSIWWGGVEQAFEGNAVSLLFYQTREKDPVEGV